MLEPGRGTEVSLASEAPAAREGVKEVKAAPALGVRALPAYARHTVTSFVDNGHPQTTVVGTGDEQAEEGRAAVTYGVGGELTGQQDDRVQVLMPGKGFSDHSPNTGDLIRPRRE